MNNFKNWLKASRIPAQTFIFPSLLLGQALAFNQGASLNWIIFSLVTLYGISMHLFIVYSNDYADYETDKINQSYTPFTGGSRVLVEGVLSERALYKASYMMLGATLAFSVIISIVLTSFIPLILAVTGILLMHAYSFKPIKLSYRGFGETLQMLGVGVVLPLMGYYAQFGSLQSLPVFIILLLLPAQFAMAISTSLPDEPSDRLSQKNTTVVHLGVVLSKYLMVILYGFTFILMLWAPQVDTIPTLLIVFIAIIIVVELYLSMLKKTLPGHPSMLLFVALSILTNTTLVLSVTYSLFQ